MPTALIYIRKSVVKANKPTLSPQRQEEACRQFCDEKAWPVEVYADAEGHRSGRSEKGRPSWLALKNRLSLSQPGDIAAVVVYSLDRSSRSTRDFLNFLHVLQEKQADFVSVTQPFLDTTSAVGRAFMSMLSIWSQLEADMDSERVTADIAFRQEQGLHVGHCPIGYSRQTVNGERIPVPDEHADKVRQVWEAYASGRYSYRSLARWINNTLQLPTQGDLPWSHKHVQILFDNHLFYTGWVTRHRKRGGTEKYRGKHAPIVSDDLAAQVLAIRKGKECARLLTGRPPKRTYLLTPLLHCAVCGQQLRGKHSHGDYGYQHYGKSACGWSYVAASHIERQALALFTDWQMPADLDAIIARELAETARREKLNDGDAKKLKTLQARKEKALRLFELGMRDEGWLMATVAEVEEAIQTLSPPSPLGYDPRALAEMMRQLATFLTAPDAPLQELRAVLHRIVERIDVNGETVTRLQPRRWFAQFFQACASLDADSSANLYPQGNAGRQFDAIRERAAKVMLLAGP